MDQLSPHFEHLDPSALYELLRVHRLNLEILTVQAAKFTALYQPPYLQHNLQETYAALDGLSAEFRRRNLNPDAPPAGTRMARRPAIMAPRLPDGFVDRPAELDQLLATILDATRTQPVAITTALQGAGGFGKTTLAAAICHTPAIINAFPDGILWVTIGEQPQLLETVGNLIEQVSGERPVLVNDEQAAMKLGECLADRRCLIVLDDVWQTHHLHPFLRGTTTCTWLITTRIATVAAAAQPVLVDTMTAAESIQLLTNRLPTPPTDLALFRALAHRLGQWPLLLELAGSALRVRIGRGEGLDAAIQSLHKLLDKRGVVAFDQRDVHTRHQAVAMTLSVSLHLLNDSERTAYYSLAILPEDVDVPLVTLSCLWNLDAIDTEDFALLFDNLSLLKLNLQTHTIRLHDVLRAFLIHHMGTQLATLHGRFLDRYHQETWAALPHDEPYLWRHLVYHLIGAERHAELLRTATDLRYLAIKTFLFGTRPVEQDLQNALISHAHDAGLTILRRTFLQIAHLLTRCTILLDLEVTLISRLYHLELVKPAVEHLTRHLRSPFLVPWHALPDTPDSTLLRTLIGHTGRVNSCAISPDGQVIVSASEDYTLKVWDIQTGTERATLTGHTRPVTSCAISPDGQVIVSASEDCTLIVWDAPTSAKRATLTGHTRPVTSCAISPDGRFIVSASDDKTIKLWDAHTGTAGVTLVGHAAGVTSCAISPDGQAIVSASDDKTVKLWDAHTGAARATLTGHTNTVTTCAISPDGQVIISASYDKTLKIWDIPTGAARATLTGHTNTVRGCVISPDGRFILSASDDKTVKLWDVHTSALRATLTGHTRPVTSCAISSDGQVIVSASEDTTLKIWDIPTGAAQDALTGHTRPVTSCAISSDGQVIVSASEDTTLKVWDAPAGTVQATLTDHTNTVTSCAISPDGQAIVSASEDTTLKIWDAPTGVVRATLTGHRGWVRGCAISPDGQVIVSASDDKTVKLWDAHTSALRATLTGHTRGVSSCAISSDGQVIVSASNDKTLTVWDATTGAARATLTSHRGWVTSCAISSDGRFIISASEDCTLTVWNAHTSAVQATLTGHTHGVSSCAISSDGRFIVSVSNDKTLKIWTIRTGTCVATFYADGDLTSCVWHPDGEHIIAGGARGVYFLRFIQ